MKITFTLTLLLAGGLGCADDGPPAPPSPADAGPEGGAVPDAAAAPLYLLAGTVFGMPQVTYVVPVTSLAAGASVDYARALEITGGAGVYAAERAGHFFVGSRESPTLTRYEISPAGVITAGRSVSFANQGLSNALANNAGVVFLSPTKAYFLHQEDMRAVIWNPTTMEVVGSLTLPPELVKPGFVVVFDGKAQRRGDELLLVATWADHTNGRYPPGALLLTIDTTTDAVVARELDARCSQVVSSLVHPSGDIYYSCSTWSAATNRVLGSAYAAESCLLRVRPGERRFDPDFHLRVQTLTGGQIAGDLVPGRGAEGFMRVLDERLFPVGSKTVAEVTGAEAWRWWRIDLDAMTAAPTDLPPSAAGATELLIDGTVFTSVSAQDFSATTLIDMTAPGGPRAAIALRGYVHTGVRMH